MRGHPGAAARIVRVEIPLSLGIRSGADERGDGRYDASAGVWTITNLPPGEDATRVFSAPVQPSVTSGLRTARFYAEITESYPAEPPGFQHNNATENWFMVRSDGFHQYTDADAGVGIGVSDRFPSTGGNTTFTVHAVNVPKSSPGTTVRQRNQTQLDVQVRIDLSPGLSLSGLPQAPSGTSFDARTGIWDVGDLGTLAARAKLLPVTVNLTDNAVPLEERCLTAEVVRAVPWFILDQSKRENDTATVCLGEPPLLLTGGNFDLFFFHSCVNDTSYPCTSADTLELVARAVRSSAPLPGLDRIDAGYVRRPDITRYLQPKEITLQVGGPYGPGGGVRTMDASGEPVWSTAESFDLKDSQTDLPDDVWSDAREDFTVTGPDGGQLPGTFVINFESESIPDIEITDTTKVIGEPFGTGYDAALALESDNLGTYLLTVDIRATHSTEGQLSDSGTYTLHVGPVADLEVRDAGGSPDVAPAQRAYAVAAINNGPDTAPAVQVTLTGAPENARAIASQGTYSNGVWTLGELESRDLGEAEGKTHVATLTLITDESTPPEISATIENTRNYCVRIKTGAPHNSNDLDCEGVLPTGYTEHSTRYYDHVEDNNTATIEAHAGTGAGHPDAPAGVTVMETSVANILMWEPVERVNGHRVTHYQVQRSASPWAEPEIARGPIWADLHLRPGQLMQYRVRAVNIFGVGGPWSVPTTTGPDAPGNFTAEQLASGEVRLTWTRPDGNGSDITGYTIQVSTNAGGSWAGTGARPGADDTSWIHRNLPVGPVRLYRIRASTANGPGPWAQATSAEVGRPFLIANYDGASRVALSWTMPSGHAVPVQSWELEHSANGVIWSRLSTVRAADGMSYVHSGLSPGDFRHYRVRAVTAIGHGPWSEPATAATAAGVPRNFRAQANGPNEIVLSWNKPTGDAEIWEYQIERKTEGLDWSHLATVYPQDGTSYVDDGLSPGGTWSYRVRAISIAAGNLLAGEWSAEASATTDSGGPANAPTGLTATANGESRIELSWTAPAAGGGTVTGYRVEHSADGGVTWELIATLGNTTTYSHTGLLSGTTHHYRVAALGGGSAGPFSATASATTVGSATTVPGMPMNLRVTGVDRNRVSIAWDPPENDGGARVSGYEYRYIGPCAADPDDACSSEIKTTGGTSVTVSGLAAGEYSFEARAVNAMGAGEWAGPVYAVINPEARGRVIVTPASLTLTEGGSATYRVKLSSNPTQPIQLGLFWDDPGNNLSGALAGYQGMLLLPSNYPVPEGGLWDGWAYRWNVGIPIVVEAVEDDDAVGGTVVIDHEVWTAPADLLGNPPDWAEDPVYHFVSGSSVKVTVRDNDGGTRNAATPAAAPGGSGSLSPLVASAIEDLTIVNEKGAQEVSLAGVFGDADGLTVTATSDADAVATVSVAADYSALTVKAQARGTATITVTAEDGDGGSAETAFTVTVKAAPVVASALPDLSGLEADTTQEVTLVGVFSDADGDDLTVTAESSDDASATVTVAAGGSALTVAGVGAGAATITVTVQDSDGNRVDDAFEVAVTKAPASAPATVTDACMETIAPGDAIDGSWAADCVSDRPAEQDGGARYARFYTFTLDESARVTIDLTSDEDTFLYLTSGVGRSGGEVAENDDIDTDAEIFDSRIGIELTAGDYTIEATTYESQTTGAFTLTMSGSGAGY